MNRTQNDTRKMWNEKKKKTKYSKHIVRSTACINTFMNLPSLDVRPIDAIRWRKWTTRKSRPADNTKHGKENIFFTSKSVDLNTFFSLRSASFSCLVCLFIYLFLFSDTLGERNGESILLSSSSSTSHQIDSIQVTVNCISALVTLFMVVARSASAISVGLITLA